MAGSERESLELNSTVACLRMSHLLRFEDPPLA